MKWKMLLIDDEPSILDSLAELLSEDDVLVTKAKNGKEGLNLLRSEHFDIVVSDISMPEMDGVTMYSMARSLGIFVPHIFFSAHVRPEQVQLLKSQGVVAVVSKPHVERLSAEVNSVLIKKEFMEGIKETNLLSSELIESLA